jgi:hypothetical protein
VKAQAGAGSVERGGTHVFDEEAVLRPFEQQGRLLAQHVHDLPHSKTRHQAGEYRTVHLNVLIRQCLGMRALCCLRYLLLNAKSMSCVWTHPICPCFMGRGADLRVRWS